jgi:hypothetical protein
MATATNITETDTARAKDPSALCSEERANRLLALICALHDLEESNRLGDDDVNVRHTLLAMALNESRALVAHYDGGEE